jgi:hypothetical protein
MYHANVSPTVEFDGHYTLPRLMMTFWDYLND